MNGDRTSQLQSAVDRLRNGDETACRELIERALTRIQKLAATILHEDYADLAGPDATQLLLAGVSERLFKALASVDLKSPRHFFNLARQNIHWELKEIRRRSKVRRREVPLVSSEQNPTADSREEPLRYLLQAEVCEKLLQAIEQLPEEERELIELRVYQGLNQREIGEVIGVSQARVNQRLRRVLGLLRKTPGLLELISE